jgi:uncharacterized sulfatase
VASDPKFAEIREQLNRQLMDELKRTGDPRVTGDGKTFERPPFTGPFTDDSAKQGKGKGKKK